MAYLHIAPYTHYEHKGALTLLSVSSKVFGNLCPSEINKSKPTEDKNLHSFFPKTYNQRKHFDGWFVEIPDPKIGDVFDISFTWLVSFKIEFEQRINVLVKGIEGPVFQFNTAKYQSCYNLKLINKQFDYVETLPAINEMLHNPKASIPSPFLSQYYLSAGDKHILYENVVTWGITGERYLKHFRGKDPYIEHAIQPKPH